MGDGFMLTFYSVRSGVASVVDMQRTLDAHNRLSPRDQFAVRIGITVGEPIREEGGLFGQAVNHAARMVDGETGVTQYRGR